MEQTNIIIIRCASAVWLLAGLSEWLFVLGIFKEEVPKAIKFFFRSCAVLSPVVAYGLWNLMGWSRVMGIYIVIFQFISHGWIIYRQKMKLEAWRFLEILLFIFYLWFFNIESVKTLFN
ncbi:MAG: hypothetical protein NTY34_01030 [Candidatus Omnitrophica bacterium]|nr:hypothetical protein [Candidatus Omnitrophota bacterium]